MVCSGGGVAARLDGLTQLVWGGGRVLGFVGLGICEVVLKWLHRLPLPPEPVSNQVGRGATLPVPLSTPNWQSPTASAAKPRQPPKPARKPAAPKAKPGLQPFFLSFPPAPGSAGSRQRTFLWALPSTSARVTSYQVSAPVGRARPPGKRKFSRRAGRGDEEGSWRRLTRARWRGWGGLQFKDQEVLWMAMTDALGGMEAGEWVRPEGLVEFRWEVVEPFCAVGPSADEVAGG